MISNDCFPISLCCCFSQMNNLWISYILLNTSCSKNFRFWKWSRHIQEFANVSRSIYHMWVSRISLIMWLARVRACIRKMQEIYSNYSRQSHYFDNSLILFIYYTFNISAASFRRTAMWSDSFKKSSAFSDLYKYVTNSDCKLSFTKFTKKCMMAFGTESWIDLRTM